MTRAVELLELEPAQRGARPVLRARQLLAAARDARGRRWSASRATPGSSRGRGATPRPTIANAAFHASNLAADVSHAPWAKSGYDRVLLDPPRAGAREVLPVVGASGAGRVVYISCHPGSLARDAGILVKEHGFRLSAAGVMDMFPHTTHVEAMAVFER